MNPTETLADRRDVLTLTAGAALLPLLRGDQAKAVSLQPAQRTASGFERGIPFDEDWRFFRGEGEHFERPDINDGDWRVVHLPHDWSIEEVPGTPPPEQVGPFTKAAPGGAATGFTLGGEGWYRKHFRADQFPADANLEILFEGAYLDTEAWLNGHYLGRNVNGYIPFAFDLTPDLDREGDNVLAVRVRNVGHNSRWYAGSGLYRQVKLDILPPDARIARWGVGAWTRRLGSGRAEIDITTTLAAMAPGVEVVTRLRDASGNVVAQAAAPAAEMVRQTLALRAPRLWSPEAPYLYSLETELRKDGKPTDLMVQPYGIRIVSFDPQRGTVINGETVDLRGGCIHHDNGILGARAFADADERRIRILKERGFNAVRSSHNPASRTMREACDRHGMLLIDEIFDVWHVPKLPDDFAASFEEHWQHAIAGMVMPARNSPSVIMWSIGNEIPSRSTPEGVEWQWNLANAVKHLDITRPVTAGLNGVLGPLLIATDETARPGFAGRPDNASTIFLDVPGYNYRLGDIEPEHAEFPQRIVYASETFPLEVYDYWSLRQRAPYFLGEFVWTAMDYLGEAGLGASAFLEEGSPPFVTPDWPWVNAWCGDIDLIGYQKAPSLMRDVVWGVSPLEVVVQRPIPEGMFQYVSNWGWPDELPAWTWPGSEGRPLAVRLNTSGDRAELWLNGSKVGEKEVTAADKMRVEFEVAYAPGLLEAVAYRNGRVVGRRKLETVGPAAGLRLMPERLDGNPDRLGLIFVPIEVVDDRSRLVLLDDRRQIAVEIDGPAELIAFGSANPYAVSSYQAPTAPTFRGRALAVLRSLGEPGPIRIAARAEGLQAAAAVIDVK